MSSLTDGEAKVQQCLQATELTLVNTGHQGRATIQQEVDTLIADWSSYQSDLEDTKVKLETALGQWHHYDTAYDALLTWVKDTERKVKDFGLVSTLEDKGAQLKKYQVTKSSKYS